jgi:ribosomal-protein-serine acetyltransferase
MTAVSIRPYKLSDAEKLYEAAKESVAELQPFLPWCHPKYRIDEARSWIQLQVEQFRFGKEYQFVIVSTEGKFLGGCGLNGIDQENRRQSRILDSVLGNSARRGDGSDAFTC